MTRATSEKSIMNKTFQSDKKNNGNNKVFYNSEVFVENRKTKKLASTESKYSKQPKNVVIDLYRARDYHTHTNIFQTDKSKNDEDTNRRNGNKAISPMHLKLYSSTMQNSSKNVSLPKTHPSYDKDPFKKDVIPPSKKKRLELLKTNYNFLKCYY